MAAGSFFWLPDGRKKLVLSVGRAARGNRSRPAARTLRDVRRGVLVSSARWPPKGTLGFGPFSPRSSPRCEDHRCRNHEVLDGPDHLPRRLQTEAEAIFGRGPYADTQAEAERLRDRFAQRCGKPITRRSRRSSGTGSGRGLLAGPQGALEAPADVAPSSRRHEVPAHRATTAPAEEPFRAPDPAPVARLGPRHAHHRIHDRG